MINSKKQTFFQIGAVLLVTGMLMGCLQAPDEKHYEIKGEVISIYSLNNEITIRHEEIPGFMPAMTMPFKVKNVRILEGLIPGDRVRGTFVVAAHESYLTDLTREGSDGADLPAIVLPNGVRLIQKGDTIPEIAFLDDNNRQTKLSDFLGSPLALTFIYTRCPIPNFCPLMDRNFIKVQAAIKEGVQLSRDTQLLSITFDPEHDTVEVLRRHSAKLGADVKIWRFLTGDKEAITHLGEQLGITIVRDSMGTSEITHSLRTIVVDREGKVARNFRGNDWTPDELIKELSKL